MNCKACMGRDICKCSNVKEKMEVQYCCTINLANCIQPFDSHFLAPKFLSSALFKRIICDTDILLHIVLTHGMSLMEKKRKIMFAFQFQFSPQKLENSEKRNTQ